MVGFGSAMALGQEAGPLKHDLTRWDCTDTECKYLYQNACLHVCMQVHVLLCICTYVFA